MGIEMIETYKTQQKNVIQTRQGGKDMMKTLRTIFVTLMLGAAVVMLPKPTLAADISIGFFLGLPVPVVTFDSPRVYHPPSPVFVKAKPVYSRWHAYSSGHKHGHHGSGKKQLPLKNRGHAHNRYVDNIHGNRR
jgi:hypothetical protein